MNFFGHAAIASTRSAAPGVVLGAMLPDFATMCRMPIARAGIVDRDVTAGIALHHATDAAFHGLPETLASMRALDARLAHGGCARGPRRAVAHVGVELLLDGVLVADASHRASYLAGLAYQAVIQWHEPADASRLAALITRLRTHGVPDDLRQPETIVTRLTRMLAHRPLLAPSPADLIAIRTALIAHQADVEQAADRIWRGTLAQLADEDPGPAETPVTIR